MSNHYKARPGDPGILPVLQFLSVRGDREGRPISTMFEKIERPHGAQWILEISSGDYCPPAIWAIRNDEEYEKGLPWTQGRRHV